MQNGNNMYNMNKEEPYRAVRDNSGTWRVLFCWHPELVNFMPDDELPDDHPAVTVVPEGAFLALMKGSCNSRIQNYEFTIR